MHLRSTKSRVLRIIVAFLVDSSDDLIRWTHFVGYPDDRSSLESQVTYTLDDHIVSFPHARQDYVNPRTRLLPESGKMLLHVYCFAKGDEMWLGLVEEDGYKAVHGCRKYKHSLFY